MALVDRRTHAIILFDASPSPFARRPPHIARSLVCPPLIVYLFVNSINCLVTGWPNFSGQVANPVNDKGGVEEPEKTGPPRNERVNSIN